MTLRRTRAAAALVAAVLVCAAAAVRASGASTSGAKLSEATDSHFPDMAFVLTLPKKQRLTAGDVELTENGTPVEGLGITKPNAGDSGVVLLIDASNSMQGRPIAAAIAAARAFAARRNPGQQVALLTFNSKTSILLPLTDNQAAINAALRHQPTLAESTHVYDALEKARALLAASGVSAGSIVLLSDGKDVGSTIAQGAAVDALKGTKVRVFAVGLKSPQYDPAALQQIASQTSGTYTEAANAATLTNIFAALGYTLSNEYLLHYRSLAGPDKRIAVAARVTGLAGAARAGYATPALPTAAVALEPSQLDRIVRSTLTLILIVLIVAAMLGYALFRILYRPDQGLTKRIGQFVTLPVDEKAQRRQAEVEAILAGDERGGSRGSWSRLRQLEDDMEIARIGTPLRTVVLLTVIGGLVLGIVVSILLGSPVGLLAIFAAPFVTKSIVNRRLSATRRRFADQIPDNLDVLSSGLRSGHSFVGSLAVCVDDAAEPSKSEFQRAIADEQLGIPIDESLHLIALRMQNRDIVQIALVAKLQREAGTNAAEVLEQVADNVRARRELRRLITSLTAQGRLARWIVSLLPVVLFFGIYLVDRTYLAPLWQEPAGILALVASGILIILGSLIIKRIVEIEV